MSGDLNKFQFLILIESESAVGLTLKLRTIPFAYHYLKVWSDGSKHYAHINGNKKLTPALERKLAQIK